MARRWPVIWVICLAEERRRVGPGHSPWGSATAHASVPPPTEGGWRKDCRKPCPPSPRSVLRCTVHHCEKPWVSSFPLVPTEERTREVPVTLGQEQEDQDPVPLLTLTRSSPREGARHTRCCSVQVQQHNCRHVAQEPIAPTCVTDYGLCPSEDARIHFSEERSDAKTQDDIHECQQPPLPPS